MKPHIAIILIILNAGAVFCSFMSYGEKQELKQTIIQLRRDKRMYDSLYRTANTRLLHFQDSVNAHCDCK
jgi:hypothetical protein